jgi:hypothetical protein
MMWMRWLEEISRSIRLRNSSPLTVGVFLGGVSDDFALQVIQRSKESDGAVAIVIVVLLPRAEVRRSPPL